MSGELAKLQALILARRGVADEMVELFRLRTIAAAEPRVGHHQSRARVQRDKQRAAKVRQQQRRGQSNPKLPRLPVATLSFGSNSVETPDPTCSSALPRQRGRLTLVVKGSLASREVLLPYALPTRLGRACNNREIWPAQTCG